jgi:hypothetical protein
MYKTGKDWKKPKEENVWKIPKCVGKKRCISYLSSVQYIRREEREIKTKKNEHVNHTITC